MPIFHYIASNSQGKSVRGTVTAADQAQVAKQLREQQLFLVACKPDEPNLTAEALKTSDPKISPPQSTPRGQITLKELTILTRQISISIRAGMSFVDALQRMSARAKNPMTAYVLRSVLNEVLSGKRFSDALGSHPAIFGPLYISMVAAGESGGFMPEALNRVAEVLDNELDLKAKIKSAMIYPLTIAMVATIVVIGVMVFIIPTFVKVFNEINVPLPLPTRMLISISSFFRHGGFLFPIVLVGIFMFLRRWRLQSEKFRCFWDNQVLDLPIFGKLITLEVITRFIRTLSSLVDNGVTALEAISVARQVVQNRTIEKIVDTLFSSVQQGNGFSSVLYGSKYFPELVADMVATGESTGSLPEVLNKVADYYDAEVSATVRDILTMVEPLMIMVMALIVGLIIAGLMLPMIGMPNAIQ